MTPLAYAMVKETWLPKKRRRFFDPHDLLPQMTDVHCFDVSDVLDLAEDLAQKWHDASIDNDGRYGPCAIDKTFAFLPAPKTWIEWNSGSPLAGRTGILLEEDRDVDPDRAFCTYAISGSGQFASVDRQVITLQSSGDFAVLLNAKSSLDTDTQIHMVYLIYGFLALINSPKVIGRRQYKPHKELERKARSGKFQLYPWTEIKLEVEKPDHIDDGRPHESRLTGPRALHFCRRHIRIYRGKLIYVTAHWRGDPAIGIKQSRYKVTA